MLRKFYFPMVAWAVMIPLRGVAVLGQSSAVVPVTAAPVPASIAGQSERQVLPDGPVPVSGSLQSSSSSSSSQQSQDQVPGVVQGQSVTAQTVVLANSEHKTEVTVLEDTLIRVMTNGPVNGRVVKDGTPVVFVVSEDVAVGDVLAIPRGATVRGVVIRSKKAGVLTGSPELTLKLVSLEVGARSYPLYTYQFKVTGTSKTKPTETKAVTGATVGAFVGGAMGSPSAKGGGSTDVGRAASMTAGAAVGAGVGTLVSAATPGPGVGIPAEAQVDFYLAAPITVPPVSAAEAARLAQRVHGGPSLYVRDDVH